MPHKAFWLNMKCEYGGKKKIIFTVNCTSPVCPMGCVVLIRQKKKLSKFLDSKGKKEDTVFQVFQEKLTSSNLHQINQSSQ